jgi:hypothetical protein
MAGGFGLEQRIALSVTEAVSMELRTVLSVACLSAASGGYLHPVCVEAT